MYISTGGTLHIATNYVTVQAEYIIIERGGLIDGTGGGYPAGQGPGGSTGNNGGSHASSGGHIPIARQYGSLYRPQYPGSGGGLGDGGAWIALQTANYLLNDGIIRSNGYGRQSHVNDGGGGSGGAIVVQTLYLKGYGTVECHGGMSKSLSLLYKSFSFDKWYSRL